MLHLVDMDTPSRRATVKPKFVFANVHKGNEKWILGDGIELGVNCSYAWKSSLLLPRECPLLLGVLNRHAGAVPFREDIEVPLILSSMAGTW